MEPSAQGGHRMAELILDLVLGSSTEQPMQQVGGLGGWGARAAMAGAERLLGRLEAVCVTSGRKFYVQSLITDYHRFS